MGLEEERRALFEKEAQKILEARREVKNLTKSHKKKIREQIMALKGTLGVGIGEKEILVFADEKEKVPEIPTEIGKVPVKIERTSKFTIFPDFQPTLKENRGRKRQWRPIPGGVAGGHYHLGGYGTLSCVVYMNGAKYVLSNNHVLARSNNAKVGDLVSQPWYYYTFGILSKFIPVHDGVKVDCAIAMPFKQQDVTELILVSDTDYEPPIYTTGVAKAYPGEKVVKSGARTGFTGGKVNAIHASVEVNYGYFTITLEDQIVTSLIGWPGDSGSLVLDKKTHNAVGLLFAGGSRENVHNDITNVLNALGCDMPTSPGVVPKVGILEVVGMPDKVDVWLREEGKQ